MFSNVHPVEMSKLLHSDFEKTIKSVAEFYDLNIGSRGNLLV